MFTWFKRTTKPKEEIVFYAHSPAVILWPVPVVALILSLSSYVGIMSETSEVAGWIYFSTFGFVLIALVADLHRNKFLLLLVLLGLLIVTLGWLGSSYDIPIFSWVSRSLADLNVQYDSGFGIAMAILCGVIYAIDFIVSRFTGKWIVNNNTITHINFGKSNDVLARAGRRFTSDFKDVIEAGITFGGGTLEIRVGDKLERSIKHVFCLWWREKQLNKVIDSISVRSEGGVEEYAVAAEEAAVTAE